MARWKPESDIGDSERIGRRLFDERMLFGAYDQPAYGGIELRHFQETRDRELSIDRMGRGSIETKVVRYLELRADDQAENAFTKPKKFCGWAYVQAVKLTKPAKGERLELLASPVRDGDEEWSDLDLRQNLYHGHILIPEKSDSELFALRLKHLFTNPSNGGGVHKASSLASQAAGTSEPVPGGFSSRIRAWLASLLKW